MFDAEALRQEILNNPFIGPTIKSIKIKVEQSSRVLYVLFRDGITLKTKNFVSWQDVVPKPAYAQSRIKILRNVLKPLRINLQEGL